MNITKDLKKLVSKEEDINLKNKKTDILDSLDLTYSLQKEEYKYTPLLKNVEKKFDLLKENKDQGKVPRIHNGTHLKARKPRLSKFLSHRPSIFRLEVERTI